MINVDENIEPGDQLAQTKLIQEKLHQLYQQRQFLEFGNLLKNYLEARKLYKTHQGEIIVYPTGEVHLSDLDIERIADRVIEKLNPVAIPANSTVEFMQQQAARAFEEWRQGIRREDDVQSRESSSL